MVRRGGGRGRGGARRAARRGVPRRRDRRRVLGKAQWIARHRDGELRLAALRRRATELRETGRTAVAVGVLTQLAGYRGRDVSGAFVCTLVAVRRGAG